MRTRRNPGVVLLVLLTALLATAVAASAAEASPEWHFNGTLLPYQTQETVTAKATKASLTLPGITTTCEPFTFELEVKNLLGGPGVGEVTGLPLTNCYTNGVCTVEAVMAENLPWPVHLTTIGGEHYFVIEGIEILFVYGNPMCALYETEVLVEGTAGGLVDDTAHTVTFNSTTMATVGAQLLTFGWPTEFKGTFSWVPTGGASSPLTVL